MAATTTTVSSGATVVFDVEHTFGVETNSWRSAIRVDQVPRIRTFKTMFSSIVLTKVTCHVRQANLVNEDGLTTQGHLYFALIPSAKNSDAATGTSPSVVDGVPNKQTFPLSNVSQSVADFGFDLSGYETDLAQDPRRGQGVVLWAGNTGVQASSGSSDNMLAAVVTWRMVVECSGSSTLW